MKYVKLFEQFLNENKDLKESLNEAFASKKLASILTGANKMDKDLPAAFYNMTKIALDKIQDVDIIEMNPATAHKENRENAIYMYFTTSEKENPYAGKDAPSELKTIPANTLLAITNESNEWIKQWSGTGERGAVNLYDTTRNNSAGFAKSKSNSINGSGISTIKKVAALADMAYCLDINILIAKYDTVLKRLDRFDSKKDATAFINDKTFKLKNKRRYDAIIADRVVELPIDKMVEDAINTLNKQIEDGIAKGEIGLDGDIVVGRNPKGKLVTVQIAKDWIDSILLKFEKYVNARNSGDKYIKNYATTLVNYIRAVKDFNYYMG